MPTDTKVSAVYVATKEALRRTKIYIMENKRRNICIVFIYFFHLLINAFSTKNIILYIIPFFFPVFLSKNLNLYFFIFQAFAFFFAFHCLLFFLYLMHFCHSFSTTFFFLQCRAVDVETVGLGFGIAYPFLLLAEVSSCWCLCGYRKVGTNG